LKFQADKTTKGSTGEGLVFTPHPVYSAVLQLYSQWQMDPSRDPRKQ